MQIPEPVGSRVSRTGMSHSGLHWRIPGLMFPTSSLRLLRTFYAQGLVDNKTFLTWLVQTMIGCNLAQAGFVVRLADEYLDGMLSSRALTKPFLDACLGKLVEVSSPLWSKELAMF